MRVGITPIAISYSTFGFATTHSAWCLDWNLQSLACYIHQFSFLILLLMFIRACNGSTIPMVKLLPIETTGESVDVTHTLLRERLKHRGFREVPIAASGNVVLFFSQVTGEKNKKSYLPNSALVGIIAWY